MRNMLKRFCCMMALLAVTLGSLGLQAQEAAPKTSTTPILQGW